MEAIGAGQRWLWKSSLLLGWHLFLSQCVQHTCPAEHEHSLLRDTLPLGWPLPSGWLPASSWVCGAFGAALLVTVPLSGGEYTSQALPVDQEHKPSL